MKQLGWYDTGNRGAIGEKTYEYREPWRFRQWEMEEERQEKEGRREERETPVHLNEEETRWLEIRSRDFVDSARREERWEKADSRREEKQTGDFYYAKEGYPGILKEEKEMEADAKVMQSLYPSEAKEILPYVWEECDKMEYEGSMMFDERPDQVSVRRLGEQILERAGGQGEECSEETVQVVLIQEMYRRRCRRKRCRPAFCRNSGRK